MYDTVSTCNFWCIYFCLKSELQNLALEICIFFFQEFFGIIGNRFLSIKVECFPPGNSWIKILNTRVYALFRSPTVPIQVLNYLIMCKRSESNQQSYMGHLDDIQTALKPLKKSEKIEIQSYEYFSIIYLNYLKRRNGPTRPNPTWPGLTVTLFDCLFLQKKI